MKVWYKSKIFMLALVGLLVFGSNALTGYLTGNGITPEQIGVIEDAAPKIAEQVQKLQNGSSIMDVLGTLLMVGIGIFRAFFYEGKLTLNNRKRLE